MYNLELWKLRKKHLKLTLEDIAERSGIGISTIKDIFRGATYAPRIDTVKGIEKALGIDESISAEEYKKGFSDRMIVTDDEKEILNKVRAVLEKHGEQGKTLLIEYCNVLLKK